MQVRAFERYIPLMYNKCISHTKSLHLGKLRMDRVANIHVIRRNMFNHAIVTLIDASTVTPV